MHIAATEIGAALPPFTLLALYKAGGNPSGLDKQYAHKIALLFNPQNETFYMFYNAVPGQRGATGGRGIDLLTSKPLATPVTEKK